MVPGLFCERFARLAVALLGGWATCQTKSRYRCELSRSIKFTLQSRYQRFLDQGSNRLRCVQTQTGPAVRDAGLTYFRAASFGGV